jgi:hypothetical protein
MTRLNPLLFLFLRRDDLVPPLTTCTHSAASSASRAEEESILDGLLVCIAKKVVDLD